MVSTPKWCLAIAAGLALVFTADAAEEKSPPAPSASPFVGPPSPDVETRKLQADAVFVVVEKMADVLRMVPKAVILTPEKYQELIDQVARLHGLERADKPAVPSKCHLKGKVEGNVLRLQSQFEFVTEQPRATVRLGCFPASATEVILDDGREPLLHPPDTEGFLVTIEKPGEHKLTLDLGLAITTSRGGSRGIELSLPRAAITTLELELPAKSKDLRLAGKPLMDPLLELKGNLLKGSLPSPADRLDLAWVEPSVNTSAGVLTVTGRVRVRVDERQTVAEAELTLQRQGGQSDQWKVLTPLGADIKLPPGEEDKLASIDVNDDSYAPFASLQTVRLKEPVAFVKLLITARGPQLHPGIPAPVGPFAAPGAARQEGSLLVSNISPGMRLYFQLHGDLARRAASPEELQNDPALVAAFHYWNVSLTEKPATAIGPGSLSLLDIEAEAVLGLVEARVTHTLEMASDKSGTRHWHLKTRIEATTIRTGVEQMHVQLPANFRYASDAGVVDPSVRSVELDKSKNELTFRLISSDAKQFTLNLEGDYPASLSETGHSALKLPLPLDARDLGGQVSLTVPDDLELLPNESANRTLELSNRNEQSQTWRSARFPSGIETAWRPFRPELQVSAGVDLTLTASEVQVRHALRFRFQRTPPDQIALRVPVIVASRLRVLRGGHLNTRELLDPTIRLIDLKPGGENSTNRDVTVLLEYNFPRNDENKPTETGASADSGQPPRSSSLTVPLVQPAQPAHGETKVHVWAEPGSLPLPPGNGWVEQNIEEVTGQDRLPVLVLRAQRIDLPLVLPLATPTKQPVTVLTERVLVRAAVMEDGGQSFRTSFLLAHLLTQYLDVELPAPVASLDPHVTLDGKQIDWEVVGDAGQHSGSGRIARLRLSPDLVQLGSVLEISYDLPPGRVVTGLVQTILNPPTLCGDARRVPTRWLIQLPGSRVPIAPESGPGGERVWVRHGWLFVPQSAVTDADLERWFTGSEINDDETAAPSLTYWRDRPGPLYLTHVPQQGWLLVCSLGVLGLGLSLYYLPRNNVNGQTRTWYLTALAFLFTGLAAAGLFWPTTATVVIYGCEPGVAALVVVACILWLQHEYYRRRAARVWSFSRSQPASPPPPSSLLRSGSVRSGGEPLVFESARSNSSVSRSAIELPRPERSSSFKGSRESEANANPEREEPAR